MRLPAIFTTFPIYDKIIKIFENTTFLIQRVQILLWDTIFDTKKVKIYHQHIIYHFRIKSPNPKKLVGLIKISSF